MSPVLEIAAEILLFLLAIWFIRNAYIANKKATPLSLRTYLHRHDLSEGRDSVFLAGGFVILTVHPALP
jgi:hypothetical protein